jgi:hypothetical protein
VSGGASPNEVITATSTALAAPPAYGTIQFNPLAYTVNEEDGTVELTVTRTGGTDGEVSVAYQTISGTATGNEDYIPDTETLVTFADGDAADKTITIELIDDILKEGSAETFTVLLSNTEGGAILGADDTATVTISADADTVAYGSILFDPAVYTVAEEDGPVLCLNTGERLRLDPDQLFVKGDILYTRRGEEIIKFTQDSMQALSGRMEAEGDDYVIQMDGKRRLIPKVS